MDVVSTEGQSSGKMMSTEAAPRGPAAHDAGAPAGWARSIATARSIPACAAGPRGAASVDSIFPEDCPSVLTTSTTPAHQPGGRGLSQPRARYRTQVMRLQQWLAAQLPAASPVHPFGLFLALLQGHNPGTKDLSPTGVLSPKRAQQWYSVRASKFRSKTQALIGGENKSADSFSS